MDILQGFLHYTQQNEHKLNSTVLCGFSRIEVRNGYGVFTLFEDGTYETGVSNQEWVDYMMGVAEQAKDYTFTLQGTLHEDTIEVSSCESYLMDGHQVQFDAFIPLDGTYHLDDAQFHSLYGPTFPLTNLQPEWHDMEMDLDPQTGEPIYLSTNTQGITIVASVDYYTNNLMNIKENNSEYAL